MSDSEILEIQNWISRKDSMEWAVTFRIWYTTNGLAVCQASEKYNIVGEVIGWSNITGVNMLRNFGKIAIENNVYFRDIEYHHSYKPYFFSSPDIKKMFCG